MNIKVGEIYKIKKGKEGICGTYRWYSNSSFIKIKPANSEESLYYEILDDKKNHLDSCSCFEVSDLEPIKKDS